MVKYTWIQAEEGIQYYEQKGQKQGEEPHRFYAMYITEEGKLLRDMLGWSFDGWTLEKAREALEQWRESVKRFSRVPFDECDEDFCFGEIAKFEDRVASATTDRTTIASELSIDVASEIKAENTLSSDFFALIQDGDNRYLNIAIIGIGVAACELMQADSLQNFFHDEKHVRVHYIALSDEVQSTQLDTPLGTQQGTTYTNILLTDALRSDVSQILAELKQLPEPHIVFMLTRQDDVLNFELKVTLAQHYRAVAGMVLGMNIFSVLSPAPIKHDDFMQAVHNTFILPQDYAAEILVKTVQFLTNLIVIDGLIGLDAADVFTVLGGRGNSDKLKPCAPYTVAAISKGEAHGKMDSGRAQEAARQALQDINLPAHTSLEDVCSAVYSINAYSEFSGKEIDAISEIIAEALPEDACIFFGVPLYEETLDVLEVYLTVVLDVTHQQD